MLHSRAVALFAATLALCLAEGCSANSNVPPIQSADGTSPLYEQALLGLTNHYPLTIRKTTATSSELDDCYSSGTWATLIDGRSVQMGYEGEIYTRLGNGTFSRSGTSQLDPVATLRAYLLQALNSNGANFTYKGRELDLYVLDLQGSGPATINLTSNQALLRSAVVTLVASKVRTTYEITYGVRLPRFRPPSHFT